MSKASIFSFSALPHAPALPLLLLMVTIITVGGMLIVEGVPPKAAGSPEALRQEIAGAEPGTLEAILSSRLADYKANSERFEANLRLQALMVLITVLLIMRRSNSLKLFGNDVPLQWLHVFVPLLLGYLWLRFGFLLDELIENRIRRWTGAAAAADGGGGGAQAE